MAGCPRRARRSPPIRCRSIRPRRCARRRRENAHRPLLKIKLGTPDDMPRLEAVRAGAPGARIIVDANEGWSAEVYADLAPHLVRLGVRWWSSRLPAGEDDALAEIDRARCRSAPTKAAMTAPRCPGSRQVRHGQHQARQDRRADRGAGAAPPRGRGLRVMVGCMVGTSLAMAPAVLVAQGAAVTDLDGPLLLAEDRDAPLL
jgi:L-alanine-DL-glutamate epimerase-like enolase superfamily enzyme